MRYLIIFLFLFVFSLDARGADETKFKEFVKNNVEPIMQEFNNKCYGENSKEEICFYGTDNKNKLSKILQIIKSGSNEIVSDTVLDLNFV